MRILDIMQSSSRNQKEYHFRESAFFHFHYYIFLGFYLEKKGSWEGGSQCHFYIHSYNFFCVNSLMMSVPRSPTNGNGTFVSKFLRKVG